jgi:hypothetical protein
MDSNTYSTRHTTRQAAGQAAGLPDGLAALTAAVDGLAAQDLEGLADAVRAERVLGLRRLLDRLEGHWLAELAAVDGRGAAGAEAGTQAPSTAGWLRARLRIGASTAHSMVRTARALFRGPLTQTAKALTDGELSPAHARVLAHGIQELPDQVAVEAEPVLVEAACRLDPARLGRVIGHLQLVADPDGADHRAGRRYARRGVWLTPTFEGMVAVDGLLEPEAGQILVHALEPLARPHSAQDERGAAQRRADALCELARRNLEGGRLPQAGGVRPQLTVTVDLDSLLGRPGPGAVGGDTGTGPLDPEACRRLACDGAVTRVLVTRQPTNPYGPNHRPIGEERLATPGPAGEERRRALDPGGDKGLRARLRAALALLPPTLGGAPTQPLEVGRTSRVIPAGQRVALAVRDGGCVFPDCTRPLAWCEAHHLRHWLHGGPTDLANLALLCRAHHRAVHEGGWRLTRQCDGRLTATPPHRRHPHRRHPDPHRRQAAA